VRLSPLGASATIRPIVPAPDHIDDECGAAGGIKIVAGETEIFGENLPQCHIIHHESHITLFGFEPGVPR
jgi:hypothetical protein